MSRSNVRSRDLTPLLCLILAALYLSGALEFIERRWMDVRFRAGSRPASGRVVVVDIDPYSLRELPVWPWPRGYHATVLENLLDAGVDRVGFDIDFSSRSASPEDDAELERAVAAAGHRVILPVFRQWQQSAEGTASTRVAPLPGLARHAALGSINVRPESDGLVRRYNGLITDEAAPVPGFAAAVAGQTHAPASFYIDFSIDPRSVPRVSYVDVLMGRIDAELLRGRDVIVGSSAIELGDQLAVPVAAAMPGPLLQALAYESLVQGRTMRRSGALVTLGGMVLIALFLAPRLGRASWRRGLALTATCAAGLLLLSFAIQRWTPWILDCGTWLLVLVGCFAHSLVARIDRQGLRLLLQRLRLQRTESLMHHVVENSFDAIMTMNDQGKVETYNRSAQRMFGFPGEEVLGQPVERLIEHRGGDPWRTALEPGAAAPREAIGRGADGRTFPVELIVTVIDAGNEPKRVAFLRDITERKAHQQALEHQATHDPLTDLPNRFLLLERVERELARARDERTSLAVLLLDLDRFKEINDALGHRTGDMLLQLAAQRLQTPLAARDTLARLGGDEFAVVLPGADLARAHAIADLLMQALRNPFQVETLSLQVDTSIGIALFPDHGEAAEVLLQHANVAMYVAKRKRSSVFSYVPEQDYSSIRHLVLRGDLRIAIEDDLLSLAYQPKISATSEEIVGVEALLRWRHAQHGMIPPDEFIGLAEHCGLIRPLTLWVIETAMRQAARWNDAGRPVVVSINLSARNLLEEDLPGTLGRLLEQHGLAPGQLTLEITESVLMEDPERSREVVTRLHALGVEISIDDFGTGYSSLAYLMRLPAGEIKIDRSFILQMERDGSSLPIVRSIIELAHNLGRKVVAEGVENGEIWNRLRELGCDIGQGYYFSRPLAAEELELWIRQYPSAAAAVGSEAPCAVPTSA